MSDSKPIIPPTAAVRLDSDALVANWRALDRLSGKAKAGAAVKANAYGLGARAVVQKLVARGTSSHSPFRSDLSRVLTASERMIATKS